MSRAATTGRARDPQRASAAEAQGWEGSPGQAYDGSVVRWILWVVGALALGVLLGMVGGLLRRRPVPEVTAYVAPQPADGPTAVGPHRKVVRVTRT